MTPTWYEILGLTPEATAEQIKAAWRDATDKFEPGTGGSQFRMFNEAADVLLDPEKRRAYDADLGVAVAAPVKKAAAKKAPAKKTPAKKTAAKKAPAEEALPVEAALPVAEGEAPPETPTEPAATEPAAATEPMPTEPASTEPTGGSPVLAALTSTFGLATLAVLAVCSVVLAVVLGLRLDDRADSAKANPNSYSPSIGTAASSVAERASAAILSYDYREMTTSRTAADQFLTPKYRTVYDKNFDGLLNGAAGFAGVTKTKTVVAATVLSTAVVDATPSTVRVLVFVNQATSRGGKPAKVINNRVVVTMVHQHGQWLVDKLDPLLATF